MIGFNYETDFSLQNEEELRAWLNSVAHLEGYSIEDVNFIFSDDDFLHELNLKFLDHDTLTDVIGFDYSIGKNLHGDIFISIDRVRENAMKFSIDFINELKRVMVHGLLHFCGWSDKTENERSKMQQREDFHLANASSV